MVVNGYILVVKFSEEIVRGYLIGRFCVLWLGDLEI